MESLLNGHFYILLERYCVNRLSKKRRDPIGALLIFGEISLLCFGNAFFYDEIKS
ncbi:hypothetical protein [Bacillus luti]|uniref:hypothetical protein n=1 Tax=Bacillus luti TaxID=2026191 RepID=UPI001A978FED|nr:hypothetical protein [Bacillus luti]